MRNFEDFVARYHRYRSETRPPVPHVVGGEQRFDGELRTRVNPAYPDTTASSYHDAPAALAKEAVERSRAAQAAWRKVPLAERAERVRKAIPLLEEHALEFAARIALETGKNFENAIGEVDEVMQFLLRYPEHCLRDEAFAEDYPSPAETIANLSVLKPYGVFAIITPFNYPLALSTGPLVAALLAGNGAVIKSAPQGPWAGFTAYEITTWMDLPEGLVSVLHGGDEIGRALVDADVDGVSFVGSVDAGMSIIRKLADGPYSRPVIAEMGGKNPVIVSDGADLEAAVPGIIFSGFDLTGQKCSALSRLLVTPGLAGDLVDLLRPRLEELVVGAPDDQASFAGPVVGPESVERYQRVLETARAEGFEVLTAPLDEKPGYFVAPALIVGVPHDHWLATTEHFLPIVTVSEVASFDEALVVANSLDIGLTAGLFTGEKEHAARFLDEMHAGGLNVNVRGHGTTGWWPGQSTFGGWKASGSTGTQAWGRQYVQQFARQQSAKVPADWADLLGY